MVGCEAGSTGTPVSRYAESDAADSPAELDTGRPVSGDRSGGELLDARLAVLDAELSDGDGAGRGAGVLFSLDGSMGGEVILSRGGPRGARESAAAEDEVEAAA